MSRIAYVHWHPTEAAERAAPLAEAGHTVLIHAESGNHDRLADPLPDVLVISLDRLPSHGRAIAVWFRSTKSRRHVPLIFLGGAPDKVAAVRVQFPEALYGSPTDLTGLLAQALHPTKL